MWRIRNKLKVISCQLSVNRATDDCDIGCSRRSSWLVSLERGKELQFQAKGKDYFLAFVEDEKRWYVFLPTAQGVERMPVHVDAVRYRRPASQSSGSLIVDVRC